MNKYISADQVVGTSKGGAQAQNSSETMLPNSVPLVVGDVLVMCATRKNKIRRPAGVFCGLFWLVLLVLVSIYGLSLRADFSTA